MKCSTELYRGNTQPIIAAVSRNGLEFGLGAKDGLRLTLYYNPLTIVYNTKTVTPNERLKEWFDRRIRGLR